MAGLLKPASQKSKIRRLGNQPTDNPGRNPSTRPSAQGHLRARVTKPSCGEVSPSVPGFLPKEVAKASVIALMTVSRFVLSIPATIPAIGVAAICRRTYSRGEVNRIVCTTVWIVIGPVAVARVKIRDRGSDGRGGPGPLLVGDLARWARRPRSLDALLPVLSLRGVSTGDFQEALAALLGKDAPNLSPSVIARLTAEWQAEYERWQGRDLSARRYVYVWADGVYIQARMEDHAECMLVLIGATPEGRKELVGFQVGVRESTQSWRELLVEGPRPRRCARDRGRRWRTRVLEGP